MSRLTSLLRFAAFAAPKAAHYTRIRGMDRNYSGIDRLIAAIDQGLRVSTGAAPEPFRENPAGDIPQAEMDEQERATRRA